MNAAPLILIIAGALLIIAALTCKLADDTLRTRSIIKRRLASSPGVALIPKGRG